MEELVHKDCGGEVSITWVYKDGPCIEVEFTCLKCKKQILYEEGFD